MKDLKELLQQPPVFLNNWSDKDGVMCDFEDVYGSEDLKQDAPPANTNQEYWWERKRKYEAAKPRWVDRNILFASYGQDNYSGDAFVLYEQGGKLFEVNGGHCSCYGLEGQWEGSETTLEELAHRLTKGTLGVDDYSGNEFAVELKAFLGI